MDKRDTSIPPSSYTLETIAELRRGKKAELEASKELIQDLSRELFSPQESKNKFDQLMQQVNAGIAAYDGLMTGIKIFRRIRGFFNRKKKQ